MGFAGDGTARFEIRRRVATSGQIAIDTSVFSGSAKELSLPLAETADASAVVAQLLKMCHADADPRLFCLQVCACHKVRPLIPYCPGSSQGHTSAWPVAS